MGNLSENVSPFNFSGIYGHEQNCFDDMDDFSDKTYISYRVDVRNYRTDLSERELETISRYEHAINMDEVEQVMKKFNIPPNMRDLLERKLKYMAQVAQREIALAELPEKPQREIRPYEGIISYIRAPDGLGPWLDAGVLTRPLIGELSSRAYTSLANWLKNPRHSLEAEGLDIPNRFERIDALVEANADMAGDLATMGAAVYRRGKNLERGL